MKRAFGFLCLAWLAGVLVFTSYWCLLPLMRSGLDCGHGPLSCFYDFSLRLNEAECLRLGVDPYDVWMERVVMPPYYAHGPLKQIPAGCDKMTNAYVPWEYSFALALSVFPRPIGWLVYCLLMLASAAFTLLMALKPNVEPVSRESALPSLVALSLVVYPLWSNAAIGNLAVFSLVGAVGMAWSLNRGKVLWAGFFWSVVMLKPQLGLLFAIPLLFRLKWKTILMAVAICIGLSIPPSLCCGKSFVSMIVHAPSASAFAFTGCGTWPTVLCGTFGGSGDIVAGTVVGAIVCAAMTWLVRKERDWFVYLMPAAITSCCWTYTQAYSHAMGWFVAFVLVRELLRHPRSKFLWILAALSAFSLTRWLLAWHGLYGFMGWSFPTSEHAFGCLNSLNSTLSLVLAFILCLWLHRQGARAL